LVVGERAQEIGVAGGAWLWLARNWRNGQDDGGHNPGRVAAQDMAQPSQRSGQMLVEQTSQTRPALRLLLI